MHNYLLFKQAVCLILFFETLVQWPRFNFYFGPLIFPKSIFTTPLRINAFQILLLTSLIFLFLNYYSIFASFILFICMRYLFVTEANLRISAFGAVGHLNFIISVYIFFFEVAFKIDPSHQLSNFLYAILAIEVGFIFLLSGIHKCLLGYLTDKGFEYALVNPNWGKFFFLFNKMNPSSWFFKLNNYAACILELLTGVLFLIPETRIYAAYFLLILFFYIFLVVRTNVLPFLMASIALLYIQPIEFHFPILNDPLHQFAIPQLMITVIEGIFIFYLTIYILISLFNLFQLIRKTPAPASLLKPIKMFMSARPCFEWNVFTYGVTHYFITIKKVSKTTKKKTVVYDGFSKNYKEIFEDPWLFFKFAHHHESSLLLNLFTPIKFTKEEEVKTYLKKFNEKLLKYAKTLLSVSEYEDTDVFFTVKIIAKERSRFSYTPAMSFLVDVKSGTVLTVLE